MRCDVNISLHKLDQSISGNRVEVKNVMGIRFVEKVIEYEMQRHAKLLDQGILPEFETRRYDAVNDKTFSLRSKNDDLDYRFIRDPDLPYFKISPKRIAACQQILDRKILPFDKKLEMIKNYGLSIEEINTIFNHPDSI